MNIIDVKGLHKKYKNTDEEALRGIDLQVGRGSFYGLLGPNSAGKTTLISIICGLLKFEKGEVLVNGIDINKNPRGIKRYMGLIPQEIALYPALTLEENLNFFGAMYGFRGKELTERVEESISIVKLESHAKKLSSRCSGGINRRANLAAGLIHRPELVFLDEPTLGVDAQSRVMIFEYLQELNKQGVTLVYTTHYMKEAESLCNEVNIIDNGKSIACGNPQDLVASSPNCSDLGQLFIALTGRDLRD